MPFPILPREGEDEALFEINDPFKLRRSVIPLFQIDRQTNLVYGKGTGFRVDPFATYLTAYHVFENQGSSDFSSRDLGATFCFLSPGLVFGQVSVPTDCYVGSLTELSVIKCPSCKHHHLCQISTLHAA